MIALSILMTMHFIGDFLLQGDYMAKNKSNSNKILFNHVCMMSIPFLLLPLATGWAGVIFIAINASIHFCIDWFTSRWSTKEYKQGNRHNFFCVIGFDQLLHALTILWLYDLLLS